MLLIFLFLFLGVRVPFVQSCEKEKTEVSITLEEKKGVHT